VTCDDCDPGYYAPHCDASILHAPGACQYCDLYPAWQELRRRWRMNYTGDYDTDKAPCPSVYFREPWVRDHWGGNQPYPAGTAPQPITGWAPAPAPPPQPLHRPLSDRFWDRLYRLIWERRHTPPLDDEHECE